MDAYCPVGLAESEPLPALPVEPLPLEPLDAEAPLSEPERPEAPAEEPDDFAFLAFLDFFLAFGFVSVVASVAPADEPEVAAGEELPVPLVPVALGLVDEPDVVPEVPLPVVDVSPAPVDPVPVVDEPEVPVVPVDPVPVVDEPDAPVPLVPEAPDVVSLVPAAPEAEVPLLPDEPLLPPLLPDAPLLDGVEPEAPLLPVMPALPGLVPVALGELADEDDEVLGSLLLVCANAMEDTEAITTSDSERRVFFNVISNSFNWKNGITDAAAWMQGFHACSAVLTLRCRNPHESFVKCLNLKTF